MSAPKVRVNQISRQLGVSNAAIIDVLIREFGIEVKSHSSTVEQGLADRLIARFKNTESVSPLAMEPVTEPGSAAQPPQSADNREPPIKGQAPNLASSVKEVSVNETKVSSPPVQEPFKEARKSMGSGNAGASPRTEPRTSAVPQASARPASSPGAQRSSAPSSGSAMPARPPASSIIPTRIVPEPPAGAPPIQSRPGQRPVSHAPSQRVTPSSPPQRPSSPSSPPSRSAASPQRSPAPSAKHSSGAPRPNRPGNRPPVPQPREEEVATLPPPPKVVRIDDALVVRELAVNLGLRETEIIKHLFMKGMMVTVNQTLDADFARSVAKELGFEVEETVQVRHEGEYSHLDADSGKKLDATKFHHLKERPPVVSIMGHVDHGKTTLLDAIRETRHKIVDTEAGGITQSIGAYTVQKGEQRIVFLDTPGHEAFTSMRMRGAQATDIAILVVAADDGVMPQTIEAINHAKAAKIPIIIAVNKIDKADADPDRVLVQLSEYGLSAEKWGGDTLTVEVSALQKLGLDDLLDSILLVAELLELKADATVAGEGVIIEAQLDKRMGPMATALVRNGVLKVGDNVLIGSVGGRVRALIDDHGLRVHQAGPSTPVSILGLDGVPNAGEPFRVIRNDKAFKQELNAEKQRLRDERIGVTRSVAGFSGRLETEENRESQFNLLVKADTQGSLEAVLEVLQRMTSEEIKINIVHSATGDISEADVMLASTANALIIGFNTKADSNSQRLAEQSEVSIKLYDVIYHITEDVEKWVLGQLTPETEETHAGTAEVRQIFKVGKTGVIAGCMVTQGKMIRNAKARVLRGGQEIFTGPLSNLKRFKDDAKEVASGYECGISFERFQDLQEGDLIEVYTLKALERTSL